MEVCVDSPESARNAIQGGASRLEVCSALSEDGLTPSIGFVEHIRSYSRIPLYAMLRVRGGDFVYTQDEMNAMLHDLRHLKARVSGFVFGALTPQREVDAAACSEIVRAARPLPVTFHRAFDAVADPDAALQLLVDLGFERVLTSGQRDSAEQGLELIAKLVQRAKDRIVVMPGAGITPRNIRKIKERTGAKEFHASARRKRNGSGAANGNDGVMVADKQTVAQLVSILKQAGQVNIPSYAGRKI